MDRAILNIDRYGTAIFPNKFQSNQILLNAARIYSSNMLIGMKNRDDDDGCMKNVISPEKYRVRYTRVHRIYNLIRRESLFLCAYYTTYIICYYCENSFAYIKKKLAAIIAKSKIPNTGIKISNWNYWVPPQLRCVHTENIDLLISPSRTRFHQKTRNWQMRNIYFKCGIYPNQLTDF